MQNNYPAIKIVDNPKSVKYDGDKAVKHKNTALFDMMI